MCGILLTHTKLVLHLYNPYYLLKLINNHFFTFGCSRVFQSFGDSMENKFIWIIIFGFFIFYFLNIIEFFCSSCNNSSNNVCQSFKDWMDNEFIWIIHFWSYFIIQYLNLIKEIYILLRWYLFFNWIEKVKIIYFFYSTKSNLLILTNITKINLLIINLF